MQILKEFVGAYGPLAIMLEDLHHFDSISWSFLTTVAEKLSDQVLVVTTMRPNDGVLSVASRHEEGEIEPQLLEKQQCHMFYHPHCKRRSLHLTFAANGLTAHDPYCKWPSLHTISTANCTVPAHRIFWLHMLSQPTRPLCL